MKLVICGDTHFSIKEPFFSAQKEFCNWFNVQEFNTSDNYFIHLGDLYNNNSPNPKVHHLAIDWFKGFKFKRNYLLSGNHDYLRAKNTFSIEPLEHIDNTQVIYRDTMIILNKIEILLLPFMYDKTEFLKDKTLKEYYENLHETTYDKDRSKYIFHHVQDNTIDFTGNNSGINLDNFTGEKIGGHVHVQQNGYLGSPLINNFAEKNKKSYILVIDLETQEKEYIEIPTFLNYDTINYYDLPKYSSMNLVNNKGNVNILYKIFDIIDAPSNREAQEKFKDLYIHKVTLKPKLEESTELDKKTKAGNNKTKTTKDWFRDFITINKTNKKVQEKVINLI